MNKFYQRTPLELRAGIQSRGYLTYRDFIVIGAWKSALPLADMSTNSELAVEEQSRLALQFALTGAYVEAIEAFRKLRGVGVPVASALLALAFYPDLPVIDRWSCSALDWPRDCLHDSSTYLRYVQIIDGIRLSAFFKDACGELTRKDLDTELMTLGRSLGRNLSPRSCVLRDSLLKLRLKPLDAPSAKIYSGN